MDAHSAEVRNIIFLGQAGSGKTTLAEALLRQTKMLSEEPSILWDAITTDDGSGKGKPHSTDIGMCSFSHEGMEVHLLDTPGSSDLSGRAFSAVPAVETAVVVVNATRGVEPVTQRAMDFAKQRNKCRAIVINQIDQIDASDTSFAQLLDELRSAFGKECLPLNLPAEGGKRVEDCFFRPGGGETDISSVEQAHTNLVDQVVELDEKLMETYLEAGEVAPEALHEPFEKALREGHLIPVCFVSAATGAGVPELLHILAQLMPNPSEGNPPPFVVGHGDDTKPVQVLPEEDRHVIAHVFHIRIDPYLGHVGLLRVHQGTITAGSQLYVGDGRKPIKISHLHKPQGTKLAEVKRVVPGDICVLTRTNELFFDAVLHDSKDDDHIHLKTLKLPAPMVGLAIRTEKRGDEQKLSEALHKLVEEDPSVEVVHDGATQETVIRGMGEKHLKLLLERMAERDHVSVKTAPPSIPYRETVSKPAEGHCRHKKQTGGAGQFAEVFLRIEPLERGTGFEFVDAIVGGAIPRQFIPAVEKGVREVLAGGPVGNFPVADVRVTVYDGKHHPVDSKEIAFVAAGKKAFTEAILKADPLVLEPIVALEVLAPNDHIGDVTSDIASHRGRLCGSTTSSRGTSLLNGELPLSELETYLSRLKSLTAGMGTYTLVLH